MKKLCTLLATLAISVIATIPILASPNESYKYDSTIHVAAPTTELKEKYDVSNYDTLMANTSYSSYYVSNQPVDALNLQSEVTLEKPVEGAYVDDANRNISVWNLPILKQDYYYSLQQNDFLIIPDYTYPVLVMKHSKPNSDVTLTLAIMQRGTTKDVEVKRTSLKLLSTVDYGYINTAYMDDSGSLTVAYNGLAGNTWQFEYKGYFYPYETREAVFCDDFVVATKVAVDNPELYSLSNGYSLFENNAPAEQTAKKKSYSFSQTQFDGFLPANTDTGMHLDHSPIYKWYLDELKPNSSSEKHLLTYTLGPKQDIDLASSVYSHTAQRFKNYRNEYERVKGARYCFFTPSKCHVSTVLPIPISNVYQNMKAPPYTQVYDLELGSRYRLRDLGNDYVQAIPIDHQSSKNESNKWTYDEGDDYETCIKLSSSLDEDHNVAAVGLWNAYKASVSAFGTGGDKFYTLLFDSRGGSEMDPLKVKMGLPASQSPVVNDLRRPTRNDYMFQGWYTDPSCTTPYNYLNFSAQAGGTYTLYAKWELVTGDYYVYFIDGINGTKTKRTFDTGSAPTLPEKPTAIGYTFKNWQIVADENATAGTDYNPLTFKPEKGKTYYFRANWDVSGVITDVDVSRSSFYVGELINKDYIKVTVQTNADGTKRTLNSAEFMLSPAALSIEGLQQVTVTYTATGATATIYLTGLIDRLTSITATYNGSTLTIGTKIPTGNVKVTGTYASGKTTTLSSFTLSPATVNSSGDNRITVTASGLSTTMIVPGKSSSSSSNNDNDKRLRSIDATYNGGTVYVGDYLDSSKFTVVAYYSNGESSRVSDGSYTISPRSMSKSGKQTITIGYNGFTTTLQLDVSAKTYSNTTSSSSSSTRRSSSSSSTTTTTTGSNRSTSSSSNYNGRPGGTSITNPDGSTTVYNQDGTVTTTSADGRTTTTSRSNTSNPWSNTSGSSTGSGTNSTTTSNTTTTTTTTTNPNGGTTATNPQSIGNQTTTTSGVTVDENGNIITGGAVDDALVSLGGRGLADASDKGISPYYLEGKWVMDVFPEDKEIVSDSTSIIEELKKLDTHISSATILRTNGGNNNNFTKECIDYVRSNLNTTTLTFKMVENQSSGTEVAEWTILGSMMPEEVTVDDICMLNVAVKQFDRTDDEIIIGVGTTMESIPDYATLKVDTSKYFPTTSRNTTKSYDAKYTTETSYLDGTFKNKSAEPEDYVISDGVILDSTAKFGSKVFSNHLDDLYEYDSYFEKEPVWNASAPMSDGSDFEENIADDEELDEGWDDVTPIEDETSEKKQIPTWIFFVLAGVIILGVGAGAFIIIRSRRNLTLPVTNPVDDFPEATYDQYDNEEYTNEEYYDDEYSEEDYEDDGY